MICEVCKQKDADIVFKTVSGGQTATKAMCLGCAHTIQQDMMKMFMALGFHQGDDQDKERAQAQKPEVPRHLCAHCGRPFLKLDAGTMAGCAQCYGAMADDLQDLIGFHDTGTSTVSLANSQESDQQMELKYQLLAAIQEEDFEQAVLLRDQIAKGGSLQS